MSITPLEFAYKLIFTGDIAVTGRFVRQFCLHFVYTNTSEMQRYFLMAFSWYFFLRARSLIKNYALSFLIKLIQGTNGLANRFWHKKWRRISNVKYHVFYLCLGSLDLGCSRSQCCSSLYRVLALPSSLGLDPSCFFLLDPSSSFLLDPSRSLSLSIHLILSYSLWFASAPIPSRSHSYFCFFSRLHSVAFCMSFLFYSKHIKKKFIRITHSRRFHADDLSRAWKKERLILLCELKTEQIFFNCSSAMTTMELHT